MRKPSKRERLLMGVLTILGVSLWLNYQQLSDNQLGLEFELASRDFGSPPEVRMDLLKVRSAAFDPQGRNLFEYYAPPRVEQAVRQTRTPSPPRSDHTVVHTVVTPTQPPEPRPPRPLFDYIGFLGPKEDLIAVFTRGAEMFVAQIGDVIDGRFEVLRFRHETVVLSFVGGRFSGETVELSRSRG